ncbi:unnamed protein product [Musa acuminata subsp. malaccensis]|uniref:Poly [ADP-ribose] polymerase n=1 Tax=Musa acuminata subsp. malaccensis TaxID=214687 RepID=A0A804KJS7_MUSAM|nr:unnamed protein product [Musa acuminata subsp. malaccensis]
MDPRRASVSNLTCWHGKPDEQSCVNYLKSGLPRRILYYKRGEWTDFPESERKVIINGCRHQMPCMYALFGCELVLVDLLCMVMSNLTTKKRNSVAWIDEADRCFFPSQSFDEGADEPSEQVSGVVRPQASSVPPPPAPEANVHNLQRDSSTFVLIRKIFLSGMPSFVKPENVVCILEYVPKDTSALVQHHAFESQLRSRIEKRGDANVRDAWFGSTTQEIFRILAHGFGSAVAPTAGAAFGSGIYLTPCGRSFSSVNLCGADQNGVQCMLLCQVILGKEELVWPGSKQNSPSSDKYDSGVDNHAEPRCYVVWARHANSRTLILPKYVVAFKLPPNLQAYFFDLRDVRFDKYPIRNIPDFNRLTGPVSVPTFSPLLREMYVALPDVAHPLLYTVVYAMVQNHISPIDKELLYRHHLEFQAFASTDDEFFRKITVILGDRLPVFELNRTRDHHLVAFMYRFAD